MTKKTRTAVAIGALTLLLAIAAPTAAQALPPDGPSPDTPGTWSTVSPTSIAAGDTISFSVGGFPAGETVHVKVDDGNPAVCSASATFGACVIHTQVIPADGVVHGSLVIPADLPAGAHWLRFLASSYVDPSDPSKGTLGFTNRGSSDFTIVSSGGASAGGGGSSSNGTAGTGGTSADGPVVVTQQGGQQGEGASTSSGDSQAQAGGAVRPSGVPAFPALTTASPQLQATQAGDGAISVNVGTQRFGAWTYAIHQPESGQPAGIDWFAVDQQGLVTLPTPPDGELYLLDDTGTLIGHVSAGFIAGSTSSSTGAQTTGGATTAGGSSTSELPVVGLTVLGAAIALAAAAVTITGIRTRKRRQSPQGQEA